MRQQVVAVTIEVSGEGYLRTAKFVAPEISHDNDGRHVGRAAAVVIAQILNGGGVDDDFWASFLDELSTNETLERPWLEWLASGIKRDGFDEWLTNVLKEKIGE